MPERKRRRLIPQVDVVLLDEQPRRLYFTLDDVYEVNLRDKELPGDPRNLVYSLFLGLRHEDSALTLERVRELTDFYNAEYYAECIGLAMGRELAEEEQAAAHPLPEAVPLKVNGAAVPSIGVSSGRSDEWSSDSVMRNSGD